MYAHRTTALAGAVVLAMAATLVAGCERGASSGAGASSPGPARAGCPTVLAKARTAVRRAQQMRTTWDGPTTGPAAVSGKRIVYVAQTMTNPGVAGAAKGVREAAKAIGWNVRVIDGQGTPAGIQAAFSQALTLRPSGIVIGGFDPRLTSQQVAKARAEHLPLIGWHAVDTPGPSKDPELFSNITTKVQDVAKISADWVIAHSRGHAGVVVFTDASIPFARHKSELIKKGLAACSGVRLLAEENIPISDTSSRTPQEVSSLLSRFRDGWTHSVAINDVYFADAAPALRAARKKGGAAPFNIGAGDGDPSAFQRINSRQFQAATVPEPFSQQGWQILDEFNRAFSGEPASGYIAPVHLSLSLIHNRPRTPLHGSQQPRGHDLGSARLSRGVLEDLGRVSEGWQGWGIAPGSAGFACPATPPTARRASTPSTPAVPGPTAAPASPAPARRSSATSSDSPASPPTRSPTRATPSRSLPTYPRFSPLRSAAVYRPGRGRGARRQGGAGPQRRRRCRHGGPRSHRRGNAPRR